MLDHKALEEAGIDEDDSILRPLNVTNISIRAALALLLDAQKLGSVMRNGKLLFSTTDVLSNELYTPSIRWKIWSAVPIPDDQVLSETTIRSWT